VGTKGPPRSWIKRRIGIRNRMKSTMRIKSRTYRWRILLLLLIIFIIVILILLVLRGVITQRGLK
jgi:hypothetical protein